MLFRLRLWWRTWPHGPRARRNRNAAKALPLTRWED